MVIGASVVGRGVGEPLIDGEGDTPAEGIVDGTTVGDSVTARDGILVGPGLGGRVHGVSSVQHGKSYAQSMSPFGQGND